MTDRNIFTQAARLLQSRDLAKGQYTAPYTALSDVNMTVDADLARCLCTTGAIAAAALVSVNSAAFDELCEHFAVANEIPLEPEGPTVTVFNWNDDPNRTKQEVIDALNKAAAA